MAENYGKILKDTLTEKDNKPFRRILIEPIQHQNEFSLHAYAVREQMPAYTVNRPQGLDAYLFILFYDDAFFKSAKQEAAAPAGSLVIWEPGITNIFGNPARPWCHSWLVCSGSLIKELLLKNKLPLQQVIRPKEASFFDKGLLDIHAECTTHANADPDIIRNLLHNLIKQAARAVQSDENQPSDRVLRIKRYIDNHYDQPLSLADLSARFAMSVPLMCREFKAGLHSSIMAYTLRLRMEHARYLLSDTHLNVGEVGIKVGYNDLYLFSRMFKKRFGFSPNKIRRSG
ncbi:MAG: AraC family transcriptional regulator [Fibrobacterota bacterium]